MYATGGYSARETHLIPSINNRSMCMYIFVNGHEIQFPLGVGVWAPLTKLAY